MTTPIDYKGRRHRFRWPLVRRSTAETALRMSRRNMIDHLRQNPRGLVLLDQASVQDCTFDGPLIFLGDHGIVTNTLFRLTPNQDKPDDNPSVEIIRTTDVPLSINVIFRPTQAG